MFFGFNQFPFIQRSPRSHFVLLFSMPNHIKTIKSYLGFEHVYKTWFDWRMWIGLLNQVYWGKKWIWIVHYLIWIKFSFLEGHTNSRHYFFPVRGKCPSLPKIYYLICIIFSFLAGHSNSRDDFFPVGENYPRLPHQRINFSAGRCISFFIWVQSTRVKFETKKNKDNFFCKIQRI